MKRIILTWDKFFKLPRWEFRCNNHVCDGCCLRFHCYTSDGSVVIYCDDKLTSMLPRTSCGYQSMQRAARKLFFDWLKTANISSICVLKEV